MNMVEVRFTRLLVVQTTNATYTIGSWKRSFLLLLPMETDVIISTLKEFIYLGSVFGVFIFYTMIRGRQATINIIAGLYFALLISLEFPYYDTFLAGASEGHTAAAGKLILFTIFTIFTTILMSRLMPAEFTEKKFESFGKKLLLATAGTILIMVFSFHVLPVTEFLTPGTPVQSLFSSSDYFFWWLMLPLIFLYIN